MNKRCYSSELRGDILLSLAAAHIITIVSTQLPPIEDSSLSWRLRLKSIYMNEKK